MLERKSQEMESEVTSTSTTGPVQIVVAAKPDKVILDASGTRSFPIKLEIQDIGTGLVLEDTYTKCSRGIGCIHEVVMELQASPPGKDEIFKSIECTHDFKIDDGSPTFESADFETSGCSFSGTDVEGAACTYDSGDARYEDGDGEPCTPVCYDGGSVCKGVYVDDSGECIGISLSATDSFYTFTFPEVQLVDKGAIVSCFIDTEVDVKNKQYFESTYLVNAKTIYQYQVEASAEINVLGEGV